MNKNKKIQTKYLDAIILDDDYIKLVINSVRKSPYGYTKRDLLSSPFGVKTKAFTYDFVSNKVDEVYSTFPNEEIHELITKVNKYKNG
tara:strand:- start:114 stop:377 length:264 start_codon:yes stop_codon:yes gene_type:complete